jgi:hypothetical protein
MSIHYWNVRHGTRVVKSQVISPTCFDELHTVALKDGNRIPQFCFGILGQLFTRVNWLLTYLLGARALWYIPYRFTDLVGFDGDAICR